MKKVFVCAVMLTLLTGFSPVAAEEITIVGTGSGMSLLQAVGEAFSRANPGVKVVVPESIGSSGGIKSVGADKYKIGRVAREIKDTEKHYELTYLPFAKMPIVFFVNKSLGIKNLTPQQICDIYSGKIGNWKDVGGKDAPIRVIRREDGDSSLEVLLASFQGFSNITLTSRSKTTFTDQETLEITEKTEGTIAWGDYINTRNSAVDILTINGKSPTDADYPYTGTLALIFKEKNRTGDIAKFVEFAVSPATHDVIKGAGGLPF